MYAYAPDGTKIASTKELVPGTCDVNDDSYSIVDGKLDFDHGGGTDVDWNGQKTVEEKGERIFLDEDEGEWPECALVLVPNEIDPDADDEADRELPADKVAAAYAAFDAWSAKAAYVSEIKAPASGWPDVSGLSDDERTLLSPLASSLALLAGHAPAAIAADETIVEALLPMALELTTRDGGTVSELADVPGLFPAGRIPFPTTIDGVKVIDISGGSPTALVAIDDIDWDDDGQAPDLPKSMIAAVGAEWEDDGGIVDMLSDTFGFCVSGIGGTTEVDRAGKPVQYS